MAALCSRCGHYIFALWFLLSSSSPFFFFSSPNLSRRIACLPYFHTWCGLSANLECRCETCCTWLAENPSSPYYEDMWRSYCCLTFFSDCRYMPWLRRYSRIKLCDGAKIAIFCVLYFSEPRAAHFRHAF